jgi:hypothetical protein
MPCRCHPHGVRRLICAAITTGERQMRTRSWAIFGSLLISLILGLAIAAVFSVSPVATAADLARCPAAHSAAHSAPATRQPARPGHRYIVAVRMGWA